MEKIIDDNEKVKVLKNGIEARVLLRNAIKPLNDSEQNKFYVADEVEFNTVYSDTIKEECEENFLSVYQYAVKLETRKNITDRINILKNSLLTEDYKIIKCVESFMTNETLPYTIYDLKAKRDNIRDEINKLELELENID